MWNKNESNGKVDQAKGKVKQAVGTLTRNVDLKAEGQVDETAGKVDAAVDRTSRKAGDAITRVGGALTTSARVTPALLASAFVCALVLWSAALLAESVGVRHSEGVVHGFLTLHTMDGAMLADGDMVQTARGDQVTSRLVFHFKDGSIHDETVIFSQRRSFQLISDHLIQKGPSFPQPLEMTIARANGRVTVRYTDNGEQKVADERIELPLDLANGLILTLLKNIGPSASPTRVSMVAATPKPRLVKLAVTSVGEEPFSIGGSTRKATHYVVKVEIGGVSGLVAPLLGKQPPDSHVWILGGEAPAFVKSEGPLYLGGPLWRIELTSPVWQGTKS